MKKLLLSLFFFTLLTAASAQVAVTFAVDMSNQTVGPNGVHIAGNFQAAAGMPGDWDPGAAAGELLDADADGVYSATYTLPAGTYQYKFINGNAWGTDETVPSGCAVGGNREIVVSADPVTAAACFGSCDLTCPTSVNVDVTFSVNMNGLTVNAPGMILAGGFGGAGYPNWQGGAATAIIMDDTDADGIWTTTLTLSTGSWQYKFLNGDNGWENVPCACAVSGNREVTLGSNPTPVVLDPVYIKDCDNTYNGSTPAPVTFRVDMSAEALGPVGLFVAGSFQSPAWQKNVDQLTDADGDDIYEITLNIAPGEHEYKFYNGSNGDPGSDQYAEGTGYNFNDNGCGCAGANFNNRILYIGASDPLELPVYVYNSCLVVSATHDLSTAANLRLYPNPMGKNAYLEFEGVQSGRHTATISNQLGQAVRQYSAFTGNQLLLEKGELAGGVYFVTLRNEKGESATLRLVVE